MSEQKLRCWPGCYARINKVQRPLVAAFVGKTLLVVQKGLNRAGGACWETLPVFYQDFGDGPEPIAWPDEDLVPITPPPGADCADQAETIKPEQPAAA